MESTTKGFMFHLCRGCLRVELAGGLLVAGLYLACIWLVSEVARAVSPRA